MVANISIKCCQFWNNSLSFHLDEIFINGIWEIFYQNYSILVLHLLKVCFAFLLASWSEMKTSFILTYLLSWKWNSLVLGKSCFFHLCIRVSNFLPSIKRKVNNLFAIVEIIVCAYSTGKKTVRTYIGPATNWLSLTIIMSYVRNITFFS